MIVCFFTKLQQPLFYKPAKDDTEAIFDPGKVTGATTKMLMKKIAQKLTIFLLVTCLHTYGYDLVVAKDGSGNYSTVQAAVDAAPSGRTSPYTIFIKNGTYKEKINIASSKTFIQLIGESVANTILTYDDYAGKATGCGSTLGTQNSASFTVNAADFAAVNITFVNSYGDGSQAVAVLVNADRAVFKNCRFLGNQDTVYLKGSGVPRCYFKSCYIDGNIDFIFGSAAALFDSCVVYAKTRPSTSSSYITAPNTPTGQSYGFVFRDAKLPMNTGGTLYYLSRPWPSPSEALTSQQTIFTNAKMSGHIQPAGWSVWNASTITANLRYAEYNSTYFDNTLVDVAARVPWSSQLTQAEADTYTTTAIFGEWDPCTVQAGICDAIQTDIAVSNFKIVKGASSSNITWNISWPISGVQYAVFRSSDNNSFSEIFNTTASTDTAVNFQYTDASIPSSGSSYWYYIVASKAGYASHITDTILISNTADMQVNAPASLGFCGFIQVLGTPSVSQTYTLSGSNLTGNIDITASENFEVSADGSQWYNSTAVLTVVPTAGTVAATPIYIRLNAAAIGNYTGNIVNITAGDTTVSIPVKGRTVPPSTSIVLQSWPLTANADDDAAVRNPAVLASTPSFTNLVLTDGTTPSAGPLPQYSAQYGQVFGANAAGNNWQNVGGTLKRHYYEEFKVIRNPASSVRVDSITFYTDFYGTQSGVKMAAAYSLNGFSSPADSAEFSDGVGPSGTALVLSSNGTFSKSFPLAQSNPGPVNYYSLALNSNSGVTVTDTLTIRLYWACSSTGTPRFAMLKNVSVKGEGITLLPLHLVYFNAVYFNNKVQLSFTTENEINMDGFDVERSADGIHFLPVGFIHAKNTTAQSRYSFIDNSRQYGTTWYRLKMKNRDGSFVYSGINAVSIPKIDKLKIVPNLVTDNINVFHSKAKPAATIEIYSADGRKLLQVPVIKDAIQTAVNAAALLPGMYHLVFANENAVEVVKFVKQ
jgi:pectin methylesterase-like acyl-CoA thioesterase